MTELQRTIEPDSVDICRGLPTDYGLLNYYEIVTLGKSNPGDYAQLLAAAIMQDETYILTLSPNGFPIWRKRINPLHSISINLDHPLHQFTNGRYGDYMLVIFYLTLAAALREMRISNTKTASEVYKEYNFNGREFLIPCGIDTTNPAFPLQCVVEEIITGGLPDMTVRWTRTRENHGVFFTPKANENMGAQLDHWGVIIRL